MSRTAVSVLRGTATLFPSSPITARPFFAPCFSPGAIPKAVEKRTSIRVNKDVCWSQDPAEPSGAAWHLSLRPSSPFSGHFLVPTGSFNPLGSDGVLARPVILHYKPIIGDGVYP